MNAQEIVPLTQAAVATLLAERQACPPAKGKRPARRRHPRWPFAGTIELWYTDSTGGKCYDLATCENLSLGGVGIRADEPLDPGTEIAVAIHQPERSFYGHATVRHCTPAAAGFYCGLEFTDAGGLPARS
ncbi:MAG TPA: PilZ domain-containing protein [Phycisphaerae bacterium]|nr:PilZ domain-containing protein [Phycisphaerae bacterium]HNU43855.1 PilZ domain-containing protein [Phycisphaerae bacterium]